MRLSRLRRGEIIAALSAVVLLVLVFTVPWVSFASPGGGHTGADAWTSFPTLRWLILVTGVLGLLEGYFQAARRAPAVPAALDTILIPLGAVASLLVLIRLLTGDGSPQVGGFAGLVATVAVAVGAFLSFGEEDGWTPGPDHPVETVALSRIRPHD
jgi:hypothetical protein